MSACAECRRELDESEYHLCTFCTMVLHAEYQPLVCVVCELRDAQGDSLCEPCFLQAFAAAEELESVRV